VFLSELRRSQRFFAHGYVGVNYFLCRWDSTVLPPTEDRRRRILDRLVDEGKVEIFAAEDGTKALRTKGS